MLTHHVDEVSMESTSVYWIPIWRILAPPHFLLRLVNPYFIKQLPWHKSDVADAQWIAECTMKNLVSGSFVPPEDIQQLRQYDRRIFDLDEEIVRKLSKLPGVKERTATSLIAEIGTDMSKFETANHLAAWSGLRPRNDESNKKFKSRRITHGNVYLRKNIIQCAWAASRTKDCFFSRFSYHQTQVRKKNKMKVIVAVARKLLVATWHVINDKTDYVDFKNKIAKHPSQTDEYDIPPMERLLSL